MREARPFPFDRLARFTRADAALVRAFARSMPAELPAASEALAALLGRDTVPVLEPVGVTLLEPDGVVRRLGAELAAALIERADGRRSVIDVDLSLVSVIADRVLGGDGDTVPVPGDVERGLFLFALATVLEAAGLVDAGMRVCGLLSTPQGVQEALGREPRLAVWLLRARIGRSSGFVRVVVPETWLTFDARPAAFAKGAFARVAAHRLVLAATIGRASLGWRELEALGAGDVVVLDDASARLAHGLPVGLARVSVVGGAGGLWAARIGERALVLAASEEAAAKRPGSEGCDPDRGRDRGEAAEPRGAACPSAWGGPPRNSLPRGGESRDSPISHRGVTQAPLAITPGSEGAMDGERDRAEQARRVMGDVPVELVVELGRVTLRAEDVMALRVGEVLSLGKAVSPHVVLRAGERIVARGELVDVEGEVGVRVGEVVA